MVRGCRSCRAVACRQRIITCTPDEIRQPAASEQQAGTKPAGDAEVPRWVADALNDPVARSARRSACHEISGALVSLGRFLWVGGWFFGDTGNGLGVLTQIGGELAISCVELLEASHYYATAALIRQLVEVEYLAWVFAEDEQAAARWLYSTPAQIRTIFSPANLRKRAAGRFRNSEYWAHCDLGGHANPKAAFLLPDHTTILPPEAAWVDLGQHLERLWGLTVAALDRNQWRDAVAIVDIDRLQAALSGWHECDPLAARLRTSP
jgi:hypothetical protein